MLFCFRPCEASCWEADCRLVFPPRHLLLLPGISGDAGTLFPILLSVVELLIVGLFLIELMV